MPFTSPDGRMFVEKTLRDSERLFRTLFECSALPTVIANPDGILLEINAQARLSLGYNTAELASLRLQDLGPAADWHDESLLLAALLSGQRGAYQVEKPLVRKSPEPIWVRRTAFAISGEDGKALLIVCMWEDITAVREAALRVAEQAALLDLVPAAVLVLDESDRVRFWSLGAELLYGWTASEATGRPVDELFGPEPAHVGAERQRRLAKEGTWSGTVTQVDRGGSGKLVESRWRRMGEVGGPRARLVVNLDVTEQRQLETQLTSALRMESIGFLAAGVAHDLESVLTPIERGAKHLAASLPDDASRRAAADIESTAQRGAAVVRQLLVFARGEEGRHAVLCLGMLVEATVRLLRETLPHSIAVSWEVTDDVARVKGDPTQLSEVLMTLCLNARDAMSEGGSLEIALENRTLDELSCAMSGSLAPGRFVALSVRDTGTGMPRAVMSRIFEPYFTTKSHAKGSGMALSVAAGVVRAHGGGILVTSEEGRGSRFTVLLPAADEVALPARTQELLEPPVGHGETILVVDDEELVRELAETTLELGGYRVIAACDGVEAVAEYARHPGAIALVLMDVDMPRMDGRTAVRILRELDSAARVVLTTGSTRRDGLRDQEELAALPHLAKPFNRRELLSTVQRVLAAG